MLRQLASHCCSHHCGTAQSSSESLQFVGHIVHTKTRNISGAHELFGLCWWVRWYSDCYKNYHQQGCLPLICLGQGQWYLGVIKLGAEGCKSAIKQCSYIPYLVAICAVYLYLLPVLEANKPVRYMTYLSCAGMGRLLLDWPPKHPCSRDMFPSNSSVDSCTQSSPHMTVFLPHALHAA